MLKWHVLHVNWGIVNVLENSENEETFLMYLFELEAELNSNFLPKWDTLVQGGSWAGTGTNKSRPWWFGRWWTWR